MTTLVHIWTTKHSKYRNKKKYVRSKDHLQKDRTICNLLSKVNNNTTHNILENEIHLILPQIPRKQKCGIITRLVSSFIGLVYEGISSFLHHRQNRALHKAVNAMDNKANIQCNELMQLENSMLMYSIYNVETSGKLITTVHNIHNTTSLT